ncbi:MAG: DUF6077 domain-containing protein [Mycoplasmatales bacterium]
MILVGIIVLIFLYDFWGYYLNKNFFKLKTKFNIPIGYIFSVGIFQVITFPLMLFNTSFKIVYLGILPFILLLTLVLLIKDRANYFKNIVTYFKDHNYIFYIVSSMIFAAIMIILTISEIDQVAYASRTTSTILTDIIYYNAGYKTMLFEADTLHNLNSIPLFNAMWMKFFNVDTISFIFYQFRIVESFIIVGIYFLVNELYFDSKKSSIIFFIIGLLGINILSATPYSFDETPLLFAGNLGTLYMYVLLGPILMILFKVEKKLLYMIVSLFFFTFAVTYSLIPIVVIVGLILSMVYKDNRYFIFGLISTIFALMFYAWNYFYIFPIVILIVYGIYYFLKDNMYIVWIIYALMIGFMVLLIGPIDLIFADVNQQMFLTLLFLFLYKIDENHDKFVLKFILLFFVFNFLIQSDRFEFEALVINNRATVFLMMPLIVIFFLEKLGKLKYLILATFSIMVLSNLIFNNNVANKIDFVEFGLIKQNFSNHVDTIIGNEDIVALQKYKFENNSDLFIMSDWEKKNKDEFEGVSLKNMNITLGVINVFYQNTIDFCQGSGDCYVLANKTYNSNYSVKNTDTSKLNILLETPNYVLVKVANNQEVKEITKKMYGR